MSERSKGDVSSPSSSSSSRINNNSMRVIKNPLLSASVTGLSYDDFPNKPQLLPAAPPVVHAPPPQPAPVLIAGILNREPKSLVTVGQPSSSVDTETLDEINLNSSNEDSSASSHTGLYPAAPDANANPLLEPTVGVPGDSLLSQAASSFTALPAVASNVFSSFSKRIYSGSTSRERTPQSDVDADIAGPPQLDIQPTYIQQTGYSATPPPFYAAAPTAAAAAPLEPPKFYAPAEVPALPSLAAAAPPTGAQNTYRLTARKKLYAPIPGFSEQSPHPTPQQPQQAYDSGFALPSEPSPFKPPEEPKAAGGLFSLTNLVPTGVLQNISGLVQTATGSLGPPADKPNEASYSAAAATTSNYFDIATVPTAAPTFYPSASSTNFFAPPLAAAEPVYAQAAAPPAASFYSPPAAEAGLSLAAPPAAIPAAAQPPPPAAIPAAAQPPPPAAAAQSSYRLQKGTRLYRSPLTAQETAPVAAAPPTIFNPFVQPAAASATAPIEAIPSAHIPTQSTSVPLFAAPPTDHTTTTATLFAPVPAIPVSGTINQAVPLLTPSANPAPTAAAPPAVETTKGIAFFANTPAPGLSQPDPAINISAPPTAASVSLFAPTDLAPAAASTASEQKAIDLGAHVSLFGPAPTAEPEQAPALFEPIPFDAAATVDSSATANIAPAATVETSSTAAFFEPPAAASFPFAPPAAVNWSPFAPPAAANLATSAPSTAANLPSFAPPVAANITPLAPPPAANVAASAPSAAANLAASEPPTAANLPPLQPSTAANLLQFTSPAAANLVASPLPTAATLPPFAPPEATNLAASAPPTAANLTPFAQPTPANLSPFAPPASANVATPVALPSAASSQPTSLFADTAELPTSADPPQSAYAASQATIERTTPATEQLDTTATIEATPASQFSTETTEAAPAATAGNNFFASAVSEEDHVHASPFEATPALCHVGLTTETTTTFFNPFAQPVSTPLPQPAPAAPEHVVPPPIGFFAAPATDADTDKRSAVPTIEPAKQSETAHANPFRRSNDPTAAQPAAQLNFFTPTAGINEINFFAAPTATAPPANIFPELPAQLGIAPPVLALEPPPSPPEQSTAVAPFAADAALAPPPLGFDQLLTAPTRQQSTHNTTENTFKNSSVNNSFAGFFGAALAEPPQISNAATFFDHFAADTQSHTTNATADTNGQSNEDQRIQNFFNNPPLQEQPAAPGELKYDIVHSGLAVKNLQTRSQTPVSNLVEPPSSACSEFSELSGTPQRQLPQSTQPTTPERQSALNGVELLQQHYAELPEEVLQLLTMANDKDQADAPAAHVAQTYTPAVRHWFYKRSVDTKSVWTPFSHYDSALLETSLTYDDSTLIVAVEGGRYDVNIKERTKTPVYWEGKAIEVRRCSWFYKGVDSKYVPYEEATAELLETEYKRAAATGEWHQKILLSRGEQVVFHGPTVIVHFHPQQNADTWGGTTQSTMRPRVVKRDLDDFNIEQGESQRVDHLLFMVHGIGSACDLKMRSVEEVVDDFRNIAQQLVQSHYKNSTDMGLVGRVEVLPISWHGHLHSEELGIDEKLKSITLESIPRLRNFTNDTLLDVLFYTSPTYCQKIMNTVATSLNEVYIKYRARHPEFNGGVSLAGHSLGSLILFDLLCHQEPLKESEEENMENPDQLPQKDSAYKQVQLPSSPKDMFSKQVSYTVGPEGTGQPVINYAQLIFHPKKFFALGSPIGMFVTIRGIDKLGLDFRLPTCPGFYNIFHPFDPVAYRIEALVNPDMYGIRPVLIPHHKGRKRMHLELKETMSRVGADIKQRFMDTFKTTLDSVNFLATVTKVKKEADETLEKEILNKQKNDNEESSLASTSTQARKRNDSESTSSSDPEFIELDFPLGKLNDSKRVDYVLQEAPLEFINEYIFALSSHVCYWGSEDTILFVMKEIYAGLGISTDSQVPQQTMTIERPSSCNSVSQSLLPL